MKRNKRKEILTLSLEADCTISYVETDFDKARKIQDDITRITVKAQDVEEMDTCYFQLLLAIRQTAEDRNIAFELKDAPACVEKLCDVYGVSFA